MRGRSPTLRALALLLASLGLGRCASPYAPPDAARDASTDRAAEPQPDVAAPRDAPPDTPASPEAAARRAAHASARRLIASVARRHMPPLADGTYAADTWEAVRANRAPQGIAWHYPWGVTLYGMLRASEATGDADLADFVLRHNAIVGRYYDYLRRVEAAHGPAHRADVDRMLRGSALADVFVLGSLDACGAMANQLTEGLLRPGAMETAGQAALLRGVADYISGRQSRLEDGVFWRPEQASTLWIDDLYMSCPFLVRWARRSGEGRHLDDAARQVLGFARRQQDEDGVWFHANLIGAGVRPPFKWSRANGWVLVATAEVLTALPEGHPDRAGVLDVFRRHVAGLERLQAPSGRWRQVLDRPELWEETSSTAMFTYAITRGVRRGWLGREHMDVAWRALAGLAERVDADGTIRETSEGTGIGTDLAYYATRRRFPDDPHSPGPVLLAASEVIAETGGE